MAYKNTVFWKNCQWDTGYNWIFIVLARWNNSPRVDMPLHQGSLSWFRSEQYVLLLLNNACLAENQQITILHSMVLSDRVIEPTIYLTLCEQGNQYTTDAVTNKRSSREAVNWLKVASHVHRMLVFLTLFTFYCWTDETFEDPTGVIRRCKSNKNRRYKYQKKTDKRWSSHKIKYRATQIRQKTLEATLYN
jgi:hypothetical protein